MNALPFFAYYGHHKCGTEWICAIVQAVCARAGLKMARHSNADEFGGDIVVFQTATPFDFWCYTNADIAYLEDLPIRGFHVVRDPRDVVVSAYFSHRNSHPTVGWPALLPFRERLRTLSQEDGLLAEMDFLMPVLASMLSWRESTLVRELHFEALIFDAAATFCALFRELGILPARVSEADLRQIVADHAFNKLSGGRKPGEENAAHHFRKGVAGDWRNHFTPAHVMEFKARYQPLLVKLGYEENEEWRL